MSKIIRIKIKYSTLIYDKTFLECKVQTFYILLINCFSYQKIQYILIFTLDQVFIF